MKAIYKFFKNILALLVCLLLVVPFISGSKPMPSYAIVCLNLEDRTYLPPLAKEQVLYPNLCRVGEAQKNGFNPDDKYRNEGYFVQDQHNILVIYLERFGLIKPLKSRWNRDGTWNW